MNRHRFFARLTELVLLFLFSIPALSPLLTPTPTASADGLLHLYRLVELNHLWQQGVFFSRWLPDLAYGYGMPLFNYYAPLVYYLTTPLHLLGVPFTLALNLSLAAALYVGTVGMFYFARALTRRISDDPQKITFASVIAAIAYLYSPYLLFNALHRANLAEQWALAFAPFALWRFYQLTQAPTARNWVLAVLTFAAVMLSHNVTSFLFAPLLFFFTLVCLISNHSRFSFLASQNQKSEIRNQKSLLPLSAFLLALTLSAFFWLPALLERDLVQISRVIVTPDFDYRFNFVNPLDLVSFLPSANTGLLNPAFPNTLGVFQIFGALTGIIFLVGRFRTPHTLPIYAIILAGFILILLMLSLSQPIWDNVSLLSFVQLPMRLRGLVVLCLCPLVGIFVLSLSFRWQFVRWLLLIALVLFALPMLYPRYTTEVPRNPTLTDMFAYEQSSGAFGTTSFGEYLPVGVQNLPDKSPYAAAYAQNQIPNRLVIPEGVTRCGETIAIRITTICTTANDSWHAIYQSFYFPGWRVTLDNQPLTISTTPRTGLITFNVPTGGTIRIEYVGTFVEHVSEYLSLASAIATLIIVTVALRKRSQSPDPGLQSPNPPPAHLKRRNLVALFSIALTFIAFKFLITDRISTPLVWHVDGPIAVRFNDHPFSPATFGDELQLINFDHDGTHQPSTILANLRTQRGQTLTITLYWRALHPLQRNLSTYTHITTKEGIVVAQKDNLHPANYPTTRWETDGYVDDPHPITIPSDLAPGEYQVHIGVYDPSNNTRLPPASCCDDLLLANIRIE